MSTQTTDVPIAQTTLHDCGGALTFVRDEHGRSSERCSGCSWSYDFTTPCRDIGPKS